MNVYDFDGTIFPSDCSIGFCFWCMNRHPKLWLTFFPKALKNLILFKQGKIPEYLLQRKFFDRANSGKAWSEIYGHGF